MNCFYIFSDTIWSREVAMMFGVVGSDLFIVVWIVLLEELYFELQLELELFNLCYYFFVWHRWHSKIKLLFVLFSWFVADGPMPFVLYSAFAIFQPLSASVVSVDISPKLLVLSWTHCYVFVFVGMVAVTKHNIVNLSSLQPHSVLFLNLSSESQSFLFYSKSIWWCN